MNEKKFVAINGKAFNLDNVCSLEVVCEGIEVLFEGDVSARLIAMDSKEDIEDWWTHFCLEFVNDRFFKECKCKEESLQRLRDNGSLEFSQRVDLRYK